MWFWATANTRNSGRKNCTAVAIGLVKYSHAPNKQLSVCGCTISLQVYDTIASLKCLLKTLIFTIFPRRKFKGSRRSNFLHFFLLKNCNTHYRYFHF